MTDTPSLLTVLETYRLFLRSERRSKNTIYVYVGAVRKLVSVIGDMPIGDVGEHEIRQFIIRIDEDPHYSSSSLNNYVRSLRTFFTWATERSEAKDPMRLVGTPKIDEKNIPVPLDREIEDLLAAIGPRRKDFEAVRDYAIVRLFMATGIRRGEMAGMKVGCVDLELGTVTVTGKGSRERTAGIGGDRALLAVSRYVAARSVHRDHALPEFWLGQRGPLTDYGIYQMLERRGKQAGVKIHPHQFRHWYAHTFLLTGGQETALRNQAGWRTRAMLDRYGRSAGQARAIAEARRLAVGDRV